MSCNCKKDIEAQLLERLKEETPTGVDQAVSLSGYGFVLGDNTITHRPYAVAHRSAMLPKKGSEGWRQKRSTVNMFFSYCPFCGEQIVKPKKTEPSAVKVEGTTE